MIVVDVNKNDVRPYALVGFDLNVATERPLVNAFAGESMSIIQRYGLWDTQNNMAWIKVAFVSDDEEAILSIDRIAMPADLKDMARIILAHWDGEFQKVLKMGRTAYCLPRPMKSMLYHRFMFDNKDQAKFEFV